MVNTDNLEKELDNFGTDYLDNYSSETPVNELRTVFK